MTHGRDAPSGPRVDRGALESPRQIGSARRDTSVDPSLSHRGPITAGTTSACASAASIAAGNFPSDDGDDVLEYGVPPERVIKSSPRRPAHAEAWRAGAQEDFVDGIPSPCSPSRRVNARS